MKSSLIQQGHWPFWVWVKLGSTAVFKKHLLLKIDVCKLGLGERAVAGKHLFSKHSKNSLRHAVLDFFQSFLFNHT